MGKSVRKIIKLNSTGRNKKGKKTGFYKTTTKKLNVTEKIKKIIFDPRAWDPETEKCGKRVLFEEGKIT